MKNYKVHTRSGRLALEIRESNEPYWRNIAKGLSLGYRKGSSGGTWIVRYESTETGRRKAALGLADDLEDADAVRVLSFDQAQAAAQRWLTKTVEAATGEVSTGSYTVAQAMADYLKDRERIRRKELDRTRSVIDRHILPALGSLELAKLTHGRIKTWRNAVAEGLPMVRNKPDATEQARREIDQDDSDAIRKRQATCNRILTVLKAGLNHAYKEGRISTKAAWERVTRFREVDVPKVRYLTVDECKRLIDACPSDFRALVRAALYTGMRYGEITAMRVDAFNREAGTVQVERSKSGKSRYIPLTVEGAAFFESVTAGRLGSERMFTHFDGRQENQPWEHSQQRYWIELACKEAKIAPMIGFHILRHSYGSQLAMNGTPMPVIASLLGHSDTRMTEKHYAHLAPSYVAETLRANLPSFGFESSNGPQLVNKSA